MEASRYLIQKTPIGTMMKPNAEGTWVESKEFDRILAERDALHQRLNSVEEENDRLRAQLADAHTALSAIAKESLSSSAELGYRKTTADGRPYLSLAEVKARYAEPSAVVAESPEQEGARLRRQGVGLSNLVFECSEANLPGAVAHDDGNHNRLLRGYLGEAHSALECKS